MLLYNVRYYNKDGTPRACLDGNLPWPDVHKASTDDPDSVLRVTCPSDQRESCWVWNGHRYQEWPAGVAGIAHVRGGRP